VGNKFKLIYADAIKTKPHSEFNERLVTIYNEINEIIDKYQPEVLSIEDLFFNTNTKTAIKVAQARGVLILSAKIRKMEVYEYIISIFPHLVNHIGIYTSLSEKTTKELNLYKKIILSTTKSCGAAQDIANLVCTVNLAEPFKSSVLAKQSLGRCRADNTLYLDIVDNGFFHTKAYYKSKKQVFSVYAKSCKDVYMDDAMLEEKSSAIIEKYKTKKVMCSRIYKE